MEWEQIQQVKSDNDKRTSTREKWTGDLETGEYVKQHNREETIHSRWTNKEYWWGELGVNEGIPYGVLLECGDGSADHRKHHREERSDVFK